MWIKEYWLLFTVYKGMLSLKVLDKYHGFIRKDAVYCFLMDLIFKIRINGIIYWFLLNRSYIGVLISVDLFFLVYYIKRNWIVIVIATQNVLTFHDIILIEL